MPAKSFIEIDGTKIRDFYDYTIRQSLFGHHELSLTCPLDMLRDPGGNAMDKSNNYIGLTIKISYKTDEVKGEWASKEILIFNGIITGVRFTQGEEGNLCVVFSGYSPDILLKDNPGCKSFNNKSLKQIIDEVLKPYPRDVLKSNISTGSNTQLPYIVQYNENRYQFLKRLATRFGEWFYYNGNELVVGSLPKDSITLKYGLTLTNFDYGMKLGSFDFKYICYDYTTGQSIPSSSTKTSGKKHLDDLGGLAVDKSNKQFTQQAVSYYQHMNSQDGSYTKELKNVVDLKEAALALGLIESNGTSHDPRLQVGGKIKIKGFGILDDKEFIISLLVHKCDYMGDYSNEFSAIPANAKVPHLSDPGAVPQCKPQNAVVTDNNDPDGLGRIKVRFFWQEDGKESPWIRIANPYAGEEMGFYFIPEIGDEVMVGFEGDDAEKPYMIGSYYHGKRKPAKNCIDNKNNMKSIITRSKLKINFDDNKKIITIESPGGNKVVMNDDDKSIMMRDQHDNQVKMGSEGISLDSPKDIKIKARGEITFDAMKKATFGATSDFKIAAANIDLSANANFKANGNATAEISSTGNTTVKGSMVMIN